VRPTAAAVAEATSAAVSTHLRRAFVKLNITSRVELSRLLKQEERSG